MRRAAVGLAWVLGCSAALLSCGEPEPGPRLPGWGQACVSGRYWSHGDNGDNLMHPGRACISCHTARRNGPRFSVAGTIFTDYREEDECFGNGGPEGRRNEVEIVDASGEPFYVIANSAGNFYTTRAFRFPLQRVRVYNAAGRYVEMGVPAPHGDCNACHTRDGTSTMTGMAPGRIVAP